MALAYTLNAFKISNIDSNLGCQLNLAEMEINTGRYGIICQQDKRVTSCLI